MPPPTGNVHPDCERAVREKVRAELRAEAVALLDQAERNDRNGDRRNSRWCRLAAFGYLRATAIVRRAR